MQKHPQQESIDMIRKIIHLSLIHISELAHAHKGALGSGQHGHIQINGRKDGSQRRDCNGVRDRHAEEQQHQQHCQNYE